ncbi:MAG: beta-ketoacyl synthase chain length factor [Myxococcales bacterium]
MKGVFVNGVGLWAPGYPNAAAFAARKADPAVVAPTGALLAPGIRRRASPLTRAAADAFAEAARQGGADLATVPTVYTSAYGEIVTTVEMLVQMATEPEGLPSPTRFHNSVHNTSAGYVSIATRNPSFSTSLAAGPRSLALGVVEAMAWLEDRGGELVLIALDEPPPAPFAPQVPFAAFAAAFHLTAERRPHSRARLTNLREASVPGSVPAPFAAHPCAAALLLLDAVSKPTPGPVALSTTGEADWALDVEAP